MMNRFSIKLDWKLVAGLTPNNRLHWSERHRRTAVLKDMAFGLTLTQLPNGRLRSIKLLNPVIDYTFYPFTTRTRDKDNFVAACKPAVDGIAQALGIDDTDFGIGEVKFEPWPGAAIAPKPGKGFIELTVRWEALDD